MIIILYWEMLTNIFKTFVNNLFKENFYGKMKKKKQLMF